MMTHECARCHASLSRSSFRVYRGGANDGRRAEQCKQCDRDIARDQAQAYRDTTRVSHHKPDPLNVVAADWVAMI